MLNIKNLTAQPQPLYNYPNGEVPASVTVDLEQYDFSFTILIADFDFYLAVKSDVFVLVSDAGVPYSKEETLKAISSGLNPISEKLTKVYDWGKPLNLLTGNFLNLGSVIGTPDTGYVLDRDSSVIALTWSIGRYPKSGRLTFENNTDQTTLGTIDIGPIGSTPSQDDISSANGDFTAFTLPAGDKVGLYWTALEGGNAPQEVNISVTVKEV